MSEICELCEGTMSYKELLECLKKTVLYKSPNTQVKWRYFIQHYNFWKLLDQEHKIEEIKNAVS